jgi:hypothetical protein
MPGKLNQLVEWKKRPFLDKMIDNKTPAKELVKWCKDNGFPLEAAWNEAIIAVIKEYIHEDQWAEILQRMENVTREFYESIGLGEAYAQMEAREAMDE